MGAQSCKARGPVCDHANPTTATNLVRGHALYSSDSSNLISNIPQEFLTSAETTCYVLKNSLMYDCEEDKEVVRRGREGGKKRSEIKSNEKQDAKLKGAIKEKEINRK